MSQVVSGYYTLGARLSDPRQVRTLAVVGFVVLALVAMVGSAHAGVGGVEFEALFDWLNGSIEGFLGRAIVTGAFIAFSLIAAGRQQPMIAMGAAVLAMVVGFGPGIINSFVTGLI